ncbi:MAG: cbb3-type cytochrome c oxidase subunit I [Planctomycetales bacterium]|nr:cbb3-type cytochrome c oxidase subunit I [Planctomycetales bacterium]
MIESSGHEGGHEAPRGFLRRYVFSTDHKVIGIQYFLTAVVMALVATVLAMLIRVQLAWPEKAVVAPETYVSLVTMHGTLMVFFVVSLALVSGFGNFLIPLHVGARDMAYPFLNMLSFWVIVPGCVLMLASFLVEGGAAAAGWTAYPPLSALGKAVPGSGLGQTLWLLAMALFIASFTMGGLNYVTTIVNCRTRGMSMMRLPLVVWTFLISAVLGLLSFPALTAAAILLLLDRHAGTSFYLPAGLVFGNETLPHQGGTPLLFQHLFWFLGHPEVYVLVLPALGIGFEVIAAFARRPPFGYRLSVYSILVIAVLSMIVWGHHMFVSGMNPYLGKYFSIVTVLITVPFSVLGLNLIASLWRGRIRLDAAMLFALGLVSAIGIGGLGGLYLGTATSDLYFHDSYFVVGHFHFTIGTVTFFGIYAGTYYWFPKMFGRRMDEGLGRVHFWLTVTSLFPMFLLMHYQGLGGLLRRTYDPTVYAYNAAARGLNLSITLLAFGLGAGQIVFLVNLFRSMFAGERTGENPWQATTLEWTTESPAPHGNWRREVPSAHRSPYEYGRNGGAEDFVLQSAEKA